MTPHQAEAIAELAAALASKSSHTCAPHRAAAIAMQMHRIGMQAHRWFERNCNEDIEEKRYFRRLDRLSKRMQDACMGVLSRGDRAEARARNGAVRMPPGGVWEFQTDPRGWPVIVRVKIDGQIRELRVGGR